MRLFNALILDEFIEGTGQPGPSLGWALLLARAETLKFTFIVDTISGTSPTLTVNLIGSLGDDTSANAEVSKALLSNQSLTAGVTSVVTATYSAVDATNPPLRYLSLATAVGGSSPKAHVRAWVCGRGPQLLEPIAKSPATFAAQYQAAKMLEDENRGAVQKRVTKAGTSLFYPPELFLPSLSWDR